MNKKTKIGASVILLALTGIVITSIATHNLIKPLSASTFTFSHPPAVFEENDELKFSLVITATVVAPEAAMFEGGRWTKSRKMGHAVVAICHSDGLLLLDTGLGRDIDVQFEDMSFFSKLLFSYEVLEPAVDQLDTEGFCPGRSLQIALSHLHWDHASGVEDFENIPVWTGPAERTSRIFVRMREKGVGEKGVGFE